jgi:hypothetical protein
MRAGTDAAGKVDGVVPLGDKLLDPSPEPTVVRDALSPSDPDVPDAGRDDDRDEAAVRGGGGGRRVRGASTRSTFRLGGRSPRMRGSRLAAVLVTLLVVATVVPVPAAAAPTATATPAPAPAPAQASAAAPATDPAAERVADRSPAQIFADDDEEAAPPDPETDVVGWEAGYWYNESIDVDQSDGLSDAELDAYVGRAMARVEHLREREFTDTVPVEVISREAYRERTNNTTSNDSFERWNDQVWEALFVVGESTDSGEALSETFGSSVAGFYSPVDDEIKIVTDSPGSPVVDNATLHHELVHALQDQYADLTNATYVGETQDADLAVDGVVEGEANYIETLYAQRCASGEWECVATPPAAAGGSSGSGPNLGVLITILQPYSDGPVYVRDLVEAGGWEAFEAAFAHPPNSTEQVIHLTDEPPRPIEFENRSRNGWRTFPAQGVNGSDTVGEASVYAMFWYQNRQYRADTVDPQAFFETDSRFDIYDYDAEPSAGWGNDRLFPYRNGSPADADTEYGYVWVTEWDTAADAREFQRAHRAILEAQDATEVAAGDGSLERFDTGVYRVDDGPFADAFRVTRNGTRVTVVNAPTVAALEDVREAPAPPASPTPTIAFTPTATPDDAADLDDADATPTPTPTPAPTATPTPTETGDDDSTPAAVTTDGLGPVLVLVALVAAALVAARRRS